MKSSLRKFYRHYHDLVDRYEIYVTNNHGYVLLVVNPSPSFPNSWLITGFVTRLAQRVSLVEQARITLPEHLRYRPAFSGIRVTWSLVLCVCFIDHCLSFFFWPLCRLFFFDLRFLIVHLVFSYSSRINVDVKLSAHDAFHE